MSRALVVFAPLNEMSLVKRSFRAEGRYFEGIRTPKTLSVLGCSHALVCAPEEAPLAEERSRALGVAPCGCYLAEPGPEGMLYPPLPDAPTCFPDRLEAGPLNMPGIPVRAGLHCAPQAHAAVGTLQTGALGLSIGASTTDREINTALEAIAGVGAPAW